MAEMLLMPREFSLRRYHPLYVEAQALRRKAADLHAGSEAVKARGETYFFKLSEEAPELYQFRLRRAVYDNWFAPIVTVRQAVMWRKAPVRELADVCSKFEDNVDGFGTSADTFFRHVTERASVEGLRWVLVDRPRADFGTAEADGVAEGSAVPETITAAEATDLRIRAVMRDIPADNVVDWEFDPTGALRYVVLTYTEDSSPGPGHVRTTTERWVVWTRTTWTIYGVTLVPGAGDGIIDDTADDAPEERWTKIAEGRNELGIVPFVPFYGVKVCPGYGQSVGRDLLDHCVAIYNKYGDRDIAEHLTNNPLTVVIADEHPGPVSASYGKGLFLRISPGMPTAPSAFYLEATGRGIKESRDSERDLIARIVETALHQSRKDSAQVQSGESFKMERRVFNSSLASCAREAQRSELQAWALFAMWEGASADEANAQAVVYATDYEDRAVDATFARVLSDMVERYQLSVETFWDILRGCEVLPHDFDASTEKSRVAEARDVAAEVFKKMATATGGNPALREGVEADGPDGQTQEKLDSGMPDVRP